MYLKRIELVGFKSFARPTTLEFTTLITAIVGPNGSGKSNIAEAIRFVLGEQSMKSLRSKRGEDLIFNGTKTSARLNRASVTIVFDNTKRIFDLDYDEVEIKRVVFRDTTNQYFINNARVRLKDVIELLSEIHIGASSHHIISQGEADRILNATIKERRVMIEDALGLRIYHYKKTESEKKLLKTQENIDKVTSLRKEIAPHLTFLEKHIEKVHQAEKMKADLLDLYKTYLGRENSYLEHHKKKIFGEKTPYEKELGKIEVSLEEKDTALEILESKQEKNEEILTLERTLRELVSDKDILSRQLGRLEGMLEYEERRLEKTRALPEVEKEEGSLTIPLQELKSFVETIHLFIKEGEATEDPSVFATLLAKIKASTEAFYKHYTDTTEKEEAPIKGESHDDIKHIVSQKKQVEEKLHKNKDKEKASLASLHALKETKEDELSSERKLERAIFELRTRKTELVTKLEILSVEEERLEEDAVRFTEEKVEAVHILGVVVLHEIQETLGTFDASSQSRIEQEKTRRSIERMKIKIEEVGGGGEDVIAEYKEVKERDQHLEKETNDLLKSIETLERLIAELGEKIAIKFKEGVAKINVEFQDLFSNMFDGGSGSIKIVSPPPKRKKVLSEEDLASTLHFDEPEEEVAEEGIDILVNLPQKRLKGLHMLSGGERALTSIALIFAISRVNPPPFLVLDETDAALDEANARKYGMMIKKLSSETQFIIITHTRETMVQAQVLFGVTAAADGISRLLSIKLDEAEELTR